MKALMTRALGAAALAATLATTGCYPLSVNAYDVDKPVSLSQSIGQKVRFARHFRYEFVTWYGVGLLPLVTLPGPVPAFTSADRMVGEVLKTELRKGGDGIVNLRVAQQYNWMCWVASFLPSFILASNPRVTAPYAPFWAIALQPMGAIVEGDVVALSTTAEERPTEMVALEGDRLVTGKLSLRRLVTDGLRLPRTPRRGS